MIPPPPKFKLYDFDKGSLGEVVRMIFAYVNYPYEECTMEYGSDWQKCWKHVMPFRSLPVLEIDGTVRLGQITTICRALAWRFGLTPEEVNDDAKVDMLSDAINEAVIEMRPRIMQVEQVQPDQAQKESYDAKARKYLKKYLCPVFENCLQGNESGWLVGSKVTWADFMAASFFGKILRGHQASMLHRFSNICQHYEKVLALPRMRDAMRLTNNLADVNANLADVEKCDYELSIFKL